MTVTKPYTSKGSTLVFAPTSEISAAFLAQDLFSYGEGQVIVTTAESPLAQTVESKEGGYEVKHLDLNEPVAPDFVDFFDKVPLADIPQAIDSLFVLSKKDSYSCLAATVLYASAHYVQAADGSISVEKICDTAQLLFVKPLGDEDEYSSRLDEIIEVHLTGVHVAGRSHKQIAKPNNNGSLANLWNPVRNAFMDRHTMACVSARLADILRPYRNGCMLGESNNLLSLKEGNVALVVTVPDYDRTNDKLFFAVMDKLFTSLYARNSEVVPRKNAPLRVIAEECDAKPSIWRLGSIAKSAARNNIRLNLHYSSVAAFRRKHSDYANEILEAFDSIRWSRGESDSGTRFKYVHNPLDNPKVQRDAIEDPNAVYGYRPREDGSLASFINGKWNDPIAVEGYRQDRIAYHNRNEGAAQQMVSNMKAEGASIQDIARAVNEYRNQSRINAYIDSNGNIKNIDGYNAALARAEKNSYEELIRKGKTPEQIIKSATKGNPAMDACTGLYDTYFDTY